MELQQALLKVKNKHDEYVRARHILGKFASNTAPTVKLVMGGDSHTPREFGLEEVASVLVETARRRQEQVVAALEQEIEKMAATIATK